MTYNKNRLDRTTISIEEAAQTHQKWKTAATQLALRAMSKKNHLKSLHKLNLWRTIEATHIVMKILVIASVKMLVSCLK